MRSEQTVVSDEAARDGPTNLNATRPVWRGVIRHVQSDAERLFIHWDNVVAFIAQYVDVAKL